MLCFLKFFHAHAGYHLSAASICRLVPYVWKQPELLLSCNFLPAYCVYDGAWLQTGLAVPSKEVVAMGWGAVLRYIREVCSVCFSFRWSEWAESALHAAALLLRRRWLC